MKATSRGLLTDPQVSSMQVGRFPDGSHAIEVVAYGQIHKRIGFDTSEQAYRWAHEQVYGGFASITIAAGPV